MKRLSSASSAGECNNEGVKTVQAIAVIKYEDEFKKKCSKVFKGIELNKTKELTSKVGFKDDMGGSAVLSPTNMSSKTTNKAMVSKGRSKSTMRASR